MLSLGQVSNLVVGIAQSLILYFEAARNVLAHEGTLYVMDVEDKS